MSDKTGIEWTDATWNPVTGCTKVSPGCDHCYAETLHERFNGKGSFAIVNRSDDKLFLPFKWRKPRKVFVNSMSDLFHQDVPDSFVAQVFSVMARTPQHTYQLLTKRHGRMRSLLSRPSFRDNTLSLAPEATWPLPNVWVGVSVEDQQRADLRVPALLDTPAAVRWISAEPLLGPVDVTPYLPWWRTCGACNGAVPLDSLRPDLQERHARERHPDRTSTTGLDWVVVGGESGPGARPMHPDWARSLRDQCTAAGVPFLFKQWGAWAPWMSHPEGEDGPGDAFVNRDGTTGHVWLNESLGYATNHTANWDSGSQVVSRLGKKAAGRELDGRTWDEYPAVTA